MFRAFLLVPVLCIALAKSKPVTKQTEEEEAVTVKPQDAATPWYLKVVNEDKEPLNLATPWGFRGVNEHEEPKAGATPWGFKDVNEEPLAGATPWGLRVENVELVDEAASWGRIPDNLKEETLNRATPWGLLERLRQGENEKKTNTGEPLEGEKSTRQPLDEATPWGVRDIATPWGRSMPQNFEKVTFFVNFYIFEHHMKETKTTCSKTGKIFAFICKEEKS